MSTHPLRLRHDQVRARPVQVQLARAPVEGEQGPQGAPVVRGHLPGKRGGRRSARVSVTRRGRPPPGTHAAASWRFRSTRFPLSFNGIDPRCRREQPSFRPFARYLTQLHPHRNAHSDVTFLPRHQMNEKRHLSPHSKD